MRQRAFMPVVIAGSIATAGCVSEPLATLSTAQLDHIVMVLDFACSDGRTAAATITGTRIELSTPAGSKVYTGAYPTYFGHEASLSFAGAFGSFVLTEPVGEQTCLLTEPA